MPEHFLKLIRTLELPLTMRGQALVLSQICLFTFLPRQNRAAARLSQSRTSIGTSESSDYRIPAKTLEKRTIYIVCLIASAVAHPLPSERLAQTSLVFRLFLL